MWRRLEWFVLFQLNPVSQLEIKKFEGLQRTWNQTCSIISVNDTHNIQQELRKLIKIEHIQTYRCQIEKISLNRSKIH